MTLLHIKTIYTLVGYMSYENIYQTFHFELKGREKETHLLAMYYKDEKGKIVFYFFNCVNEVQLESERIKNITYKKDEAFLEALAGTRYKMKRPDFPKE